VLLGLGVHFLQEHFLVKISSQRLLLCDALLICELLQNNGVWDNYGDNVVLQGVTIDEDLSDFGDLRVNVLKFFRGNVLTLGELKDILGAVSNLKRAIG